MSDILQVNRSIRNILIIFLGIVLFALLKLLAHLLLPLILACLLALLCIPMVDKLKRMGVPKLLTILLTALVVGFSLMIVVNIFANTITDILDDLDMLILQFNQKVEIISQWVTETFNLEIPQGNESYAAWLNQWFGSLNWAGALRSTLFGIGDFGKDFLLFLLYFMFLLGGLSEYRQFIDYVVGERKELKSHTETMQKSISSYIAIKTVISLGTGVLAFFICLIFGLNYALFWGFVAFLFNFIPSIGSILSTVLPVLLAFVQFDSVGRFLGLALALLAVQLVIGNIIDPMVMGDRMRLNSITVIFGLLFWGYIWGIPGMLLSVPLNVILKLILEQSENLAIASRIMGGFKPKKVNKRTIRKPNKTNRSPAEESPEE